MYRFILGTLGLVASACTAADGGRASKSGETHCESPTLLTIYSKPGCDGSVKPTCGGAAGACAVLATACGCDGKPIGLDCEHRILAPYQFEFPGYPPDLTQCKPAPGYDAGKNIRP